MKTARQVVENLTESQNPRAALVSISSELDDLKDLFAGLGGSVDGSAAWKVLRELRKADTAIQNAYPHLGLST